MEPRFNYFKACSVVTTWYEQIGDPTGFDGILDRLVHNAHCIEMRGDSMRKIEGSRTRTISRW